MKFRIISIFLSICCTVSIWFTPLAATAIDFSVIDTDQDGLTDLQELETYKTQSKLSDTDNDGYLDGDEVINGYDPNALDPYAKLEKHIEVSLKDQTLTYYMGPYKIGSFLISSGLPRTPTPKGSFTVLKKRPTVNYKGVGYNYPNTKWNLLFKNSKPGGYYIHGAFWHNKFGRTASHGCVNVAYKDMESLYNWADEGTKVNVR